MRHCRVGTVSALGLVLLSACAGSQRPTEEPYDEARKPLCARARNCLATGEALLREAPVEALEVACAVDKRTCGTKTSEGEPRPPWH